MEGNVHIPQLVAAQGALQGAPPFKLSAYSYKRWVEPSPYEHEASNLLTNTEMIHRAAEDIKELASQLGASRIILGGHDW